MLCPNCGKNMSDDTKFCTACGASMAPAQNASNPEPHIPTNSAAYPQATQINTPPTEAATPIPTPQGTPAATPQPAPFFQTGPQISSAAPAQNSPLKPAKHGISSPATFAAICIATIALVLAIVGLIFPGSGKLQAVEAGTAVITIKAGETSAAERILPANSPYIVVATSVGGNSTYSDVMYDKGSGELYIFADHASDSDKQRLVNWVAFNQ